MGTKGTGTLATTGSLLTTSTLLTTRSKTIPCASLWRWVLCLSCLVLLLVSSGLLSTGRVLQFVLLIVVRTRARPARRGLQAMVVRLVLKPMSYVLILGIV